MAKKCDDLIQEYSMIFSTIQSIIRRLINLSSCNILDCCAFLHKYKGFLLILVVTKIGFENSWSPTHAFGIKWFCTHA